MKAMTSDLAKENELLNEVGQVSPAFVRAWYRDKSNMKDEQIFRFWREDHDSNNYTPNFEELLKKNDLSLQDIPGDVDWEEYSKKVPKLSSGSLSEYHLIFHYLKQQQRRRNFDANFYRSYYVLGNELSDAEIFQNWLCDVQENRNASSLLDLLEQNGLSCVGELLASSQNDLITVGNKNTAETWNEIVLRLKYFPWRIGRITSCDNTNQQILIALCDTYRQMGLLKKARKLRQLAIENSYICETGNQDILDDQDLIISKHTKIDPDFYFEWYSDLEEKDTLYLEDHWYNFGFQEGRAPTLDHALKTLNLEIENLPIFFELHDYMQFIKGHLPSHNTNHYSTIIQKLQSIKDYGKFDPVFYTDAYEDVAELKNNPWKSEMHWITQGRADGRYGNLNQFLNDLNLTRQILPSWFAIGNIRTLNQNISGSNLELLTHILQTSAPAAVRVSESAERNSEFYFNLAHHHEKLNHRDLAENYYLIADNFSENGLALEHIGNIYFNCGLYKRAGEFYSKAISTESCTEWAYINKIKCSIKNSNMTEVLATFKKAKRLYPENSKLEVATKGFISELWAACTKLTATMMKQNHRQHLIENIELTSKTIYGITETSVKLGSEGKFSGSICKNKILIIGDFHLPQCKRYRIDQKIEQFEAAGFITESVSWTEAEKATQSLAFADICIFYRCPALPEIVELIAVANALGKISIYEIDDLIFDAAYPGPFDSYGGYISTDEYYDLIKGMSLYRAAAKLCRYGIASTQPLCNELSKLVSSSKCFLHRNALDSHNEQVVHNRSKVKKTIDIFYGSGTKAHNSDFVTEALPAIVKILEENPAVRLTIVGYLTLPENISSKFRSQIISAPMIDSIQGYSAYLANADINIAVLKPDKINDSKSEIKWLEAAVFSVPSVLSCTQNYLDTVDDGVDGYLAYCVDDWYRILNNLVRDNALRSAIGQKARSRALEEYGVDRMSNRIVSIIDLIVRDHEGKAAFAIQKGSKP